MRLRAVGSQTPTWSQIPYYMPASCQQCWPQSKSVRFLHTHIISLLNLNLGGSRSQHNCHLSLDCSASSQPASLWNLSSRKRNQTCACPLHCTPGKVVHPGKESFAHDLPGLSHLVLGEGQAPTPHPWGETGSVAHAERLLFRVLPVSTVTSHLSPPGVERFMSSTSACSFGAKSIAIHLWYFH